MSIDEKEPEEVARLFREELDRHGYSFQEAMIAKICEVNRSSHCRSNWLPWVPELPVEVGGNHTRIDFVYANERQSAYLIFECKRSNPGLSNWCFARSIFKLPHEFADCAYAESIVAVGTKILRSSTHKLSPSQEPYHISLDIPSRSKGDAQGKGRGQIEEAATQVCRHLNGLVEFFYKHTCLVQPGKTIALVPVILTTAQLWVTEFELHTANPETGKIETDTLRVRPVPWLWYQYHQSPGLKHSGPSWNPPEKIDSILYQEFIRPIAVVTPSGLGNFLGSQFWNTL